MRMISLFGWLDKIPFWRNLAYPTKGALLRAMKAALSVFIGILLAAATDGSIFPEGTGSITIIAVTMILQSVDKFLRETDIANTALSDEAHVTGLAGAGEVNTDATSVETDGTVNTDSTIEENPTP